MRFSIGRPIEQSESTPLSGDQTGCCANDPLSTEIRTTVQSGFQRCSNVLRNENEWRAVCAMMLLGYARVSTNEQDTSAQVSALKSAGCGKIFLEKASGGRWDRPELQRLLNQLRKGDIVVCCRLDRMSRSVRDILMIMERIKEAEAGFKSLTEAIDTTTVSGTMMMRLIAVFAQFERSVPPCIGGHFTEP
jgi:hypothetical protein